MSFLTGLARSSTQLLCERPLASCSSRIALPMVAKTAAAAAAATATVRRNGTQTPRRQGVGTSPWNAVIDNALRAAAPRRRDMTPDEAWERRSASRYARLQQNPIPGPSTGRTIYISQDQPFHVALNRLDHILRTNYVRRDLMEGRFFIKGHVRRHRLNAVRWRRRFAQMVREKVQIVQGIRKRGM